MKEKHWNLGSSKVCGILTCPISTTTPPSCVVALESKSPQQSESQQTNNSLWRGQNGVGTLPKTHSQRIVIASISPVEWLPICKSFLYLMWLSTFLGQQKGIYKKQSPWDDDSSGANNKLIKKQTNKKPKRESWRMIFPLEVLKSSAIFLWI